MARSCAVFSTRRCANAKAQLQTSDDYLRLLTYRYHTVPRRAHQQHIPAQHDGMGAQCATTGWPSNALGWIKAHGLADPGCWAYQTANAPYAPTSDRSGRTVRLGNYVTLNNIQDQKNWLDNVEPISACFTCYNDFFAYGPNSGVYTQTTNAVAGGHCIVIVGYDDTKGAWLIRNSWGTGCWMNQAVMLHTPSISSSASLTPKLF